MLSHSEIALGVSLSSPLASIVSHETANGPFLLAEWRAVAFTQQ
jgi:hypothetical protein